MNETSDDDVPDAEPVLKTVRSSVAVDAPSAVADAVLRNVPFSSEVDAPVPFADAVLGAVCKPTAVSFAVAEPEP